jgi:iron uptake system EfeUOB component EfeO/EfeM
MQYQPELLPSEARKITMIDDKHAHLLREWREHHETMVRMHTWNEYEKLKQKMTGFIVAAAICAAAVGILAVWSH